MNAVDNFKSELREYLLNFELDYFHRPVVVEYSLDGVELLYAYKDKITKEEFLKAFQEVRTEIIFNDLPNWHEQLLRKGDMNVNGMEDEHIEFINVINEIVIDWNNISFWDSSFEDYVEWWKAGYK